MRPVGQSLLGEMAIGCPLPFRNALNLGDVTKRRLASRQQRLLAAKAESSQALHISTNADGTVTYSFGVEAEAASHSPAALHTHAAATAAAAAVTVTAVPPNILEDTEATAGVAASAVQHTETAVAHLDKLLHITPSVAEVAALNGRSSSGNGASTSKNGSKPPHGHGHSNGNGNGNGAGYPPPPVLPLDTAAVNFSEPPAISILKLYSALCAAGRLDDALVVLKESMRAGREDVLRKLKHSEFLRAAARHRSVRHALRFVQLLPRQFVDARTYNMVVSVCAETGDVRNALRCADMLKVAGLRPDTILYTNLIKVCAAAGDAEHAFELFKEMQAAGVRLEKQIFATLISACAVQIDRTHASDRRTQLVLLERAFGLIETMDAARVQPDAAVWNALINAAGRAGQLQRAFDVLDEMLSRSSKPNAWTYASLVDACARTGDKDMAMRVYGKALREGFGGELRVYSSAINACVKAKSGADLEGAMSIYNDMQRNNVAPDSALYGALMMAAGRAGKLDLTLDLQAEMLRDGLEPCVGTESALLTVNVQNGRLAEAQAIYRQLRSSGQLPHEHAVNAMINAFAKALRMGDVVSLVCDAVEAGMTPDAFTFAAVLNACHWCDECELALDVYRVMRLRGIRMDEVHTLLLLRMCYSRLRQNWQKGGYPPQGTPAVAAIPPSSVEAAGGRRTKLRAKLLAALAPGDKKVELREPSLEVPWQGHAFHIYREAVSAGVRPSLRLLNLMLMCLRVPWSSVASNDGDIQDLAAQTQALHAGLGPAQPTVQRKIGVESVYHVQAVSILEEAIVSGNLPGFKADSQAPFDLRTFPPAVAEVYALTVLSSLQRMVVEGRRPVKHRAVFVVPRYDGRQVFRPSFADAHEALAEEPSAEHHHPHKGASASSQQDRASLDSLFEESDSDAEYDSSMDDGALRAEDEAPFADERTGLGVAGVLRRVRLWAREYSPEGLIVLEPREIGRWAKEIQREVESRSASALPMQKPYGQATMGLLQQSRSIRLGL